MFIELNIIRPLKRLYHILLSILGGVKYGNPSKSLKLIGITGTSGKSTTATMIYQILKSSGFKVGLISTVEAIIGDEKVDTGFHVTSPDPMDLQKLLGKMRDRGMEYVVVEASSHALEQGRFGLLKFDYAVVTNIKRDHLDWHITWKDYARAKARLIDKLKSGSKAIINRDDNDSYEYLFNRYPYIGKFIKYSVSNEVKNISETSEGLSFYYKNCNFDLKIIGKYNVDNALAAIKLGEELKISVENISKALAEFEGLEGRMQIMQTKPFMVIVDFAHNTDSLIRSLKAARELADDEGKVICVFGSAGLRDKEKRFTMGGASGELADVTIITAEDPRTESLYDINTKIIKGAEAKGAELVKRFRDHEAYVEFSISNFQFSNKIVFVFNEESVQGRFDAIDLAIKLAKPGDVVITEGKGHEKSLAFGTTEYPFTDQEAVKRALKVKSEIRIPKIQTISKS